VSSTILHHISSPRVITLSSREEKNKGVVREAGDKEYDSDYFSIRVLRTDKARKEGWGDNIPHLETGNIEEGAPASLLTHCQIQNKQCLSFVVTPKVTLPYLERNTAEYYPLVESALKAIGITAGKAGVTGGGVKEVELNTSLYL